MSWRKRRKKCKTLGVTVPLPPELQEQIREQMANPQPQKLIPCKIKEIKPLVAPTPAIFFFQPKYGSTKGEVSGGEEAQT